MNGRSVSGRSAECGIQPAVRSDGGVPLFQGLVFQGLVFQGLVFQGLVFQGLEAPGYSPSPRWGGEQRGVAGGSVGPGFQGLEAPGY